MQINEVERSDMEDEKIEITWFVDDGYICRDRPQKFKINLSDFEFCESEKEVADILYEELDEHLKQRANWICRGLESLIGEIFDKATKYREENATHVDT